MMQDELRGAYLVNLVSQVGDRLSGVIILLVLIRYIPDADFARLNELLVFLGLLGLLADFGTSQQIPHASRRGDLPALFALRTTIFIVIIFALWYFVASALEVFFVVTGVFEVIVRSPQLFVEHPSAQRFFHWSVFVKVLSLLCLAAVLALGPGRNLDAVLFGLTVSTGLSGAICIMATAPLVRSLDFNMARMKPLAQGGASVCLSQCLYFARMGVPLLFVSTYAPSLAKELRLWGALQSLCQQATFVICGAYYSLLVSGSSHLRQFAKAIIKLELVAGIGLLITLAIVFNTPVVPWLFGRTPDMFSQHAVAGSLASLSIPPALAAIAYLTATQRYRSLLTVNTIGALAGTASCLLFAGFTLTTIIFLAPFVFDLSVIAGAGLSHADRIRRGPKIFL